MRETIYQEIEKELAYAETQWGTEFDDKNTANDWAAYISVYTGQAAAMNRETRVFDAERFRKNMLKVAGLAISAVATLDKNKENFAKRHYDK